MSYSSALGAFWAGLIIGILLMGFIETCIPGYGYHDAMKSRDACEKSLPRDQVCIPTYMPSSSSTKP